MLSRRTLLGTGAAVAAGALLGGCGIGKGSGSPGQGQQSVNTSEKLSGKIIFQTWSLKNDKFTAYFNDRIKTFQADNPGTSVEWIDQPGEGYATKITSQISANSLPDVINLPPDIAYQAAKVGALLNLQGNVADLESTWQKSGLDAYSYQGLQGTFGLPWYLGTDVYFWNADMFSQVGLDAKHPPTSLEELFDQAKIMHDKSDGKMYMISNKPGFINFVNAGVPLINDDGTKFVFNTAAAAATIDTYAKAYQNGYMPESVLSSDYQGNAALFNKQIVAWTTGTGYYLQSLKRENPNLAKHVLPSKAFGTPPLYVQGCSVAAKSQNLPLAVAFATYMLNNENQLAFVDIAEGFLPGTTAGTSDPRFAKSDGTPAGDAEVLAAESLPDAQNMTPPQWTADMSTYLDQQIALAMQGKESPQQALDKAVSKASTLMSS